MIAIPKGSKRAKKPTLASLKKKLDAVFSEWIRRKDAINGLAKCVTCGKQARWQEMQCGHFISRTHLATRFSPTNCAVQCVMCNVFKHGNYIEYVVWMVENYGYSVIEDLREEKHRQVKYSRSDYEAMITEYREKLSTLDLRMAA